MTELQDSFAELKSRYTYKFVEAERKDGILTIQGIGDKPSSIFGNRPSFFTLQGTKMVLLVLSCGPGGFGNLRPAMREDIENGLR